MAMSVSPFRLSRLPLLALLLGPALSQPAFEYAKSATNEQGTPLIQLSDTYANGEKAEVVLTMMPGEGDVQKSNFDWRSCQIENTGNKRIAAVYIDVQTGIFQDMVFDDDGSGGDDVAKGLNHDWGTTETNPISVDQYEWRWKPARSGSFDPTAAFDATDLSNVDNLFVDELSDSGLGCAGGYRGALILFEDFDGGETYEFSVDMDPNSIAGLQQGTASIHAEWDVGGVSGAELVGSVVTVLFGDGTTGTGTMAPDGSQAGAIAIVSDNLGNAPGLTIGSLGSGESGTYSASPSVAVTSTPGTTVRVTMYQGFDPVDNQKPLAGGKIDAEALVMARLGAQYPEFPVNNARLLQHAEVVIPSSGSADIGAMFQFEGQYALGFTAVAIDSVGKWPVSEMTAPVRLVFDESGPLPEPSSHIKCLWGGSTGHLRVTSDKEWSGLAVKADDGSLSQEWDFELVEKDVYIIRNRRNGQVLTRKATSSGEPSKHVAIAKPRNKWSRQKWAVECPTNGGACRIKNRWGSNGYLNRLAILNQKTNKWEPTEGVELRWYNKAWSSQQWIITIPKVAPTPAPTPSPIKVPTNSNISCRWGESSGDLGVKGKTEYSGLQLGVGGSVLGQEWDMVSVDQGIFVIRNRWNGLVLSRRGTKSGDKWIPNSSVDIATLRSNWSSQKWTLECEKDGWCRIRNMWGSDGYLNRMGDKKGDTWIPNSGVGLRPKTATWTSQQWRVPIANK